MFYVYFNKYPRSTYTPTGETIFFNEKEYIGPFMDRSEAIEYIASRSKESFEFELISWG